MSLRANKTLTLLAHVNFEFEARACLQIPLLLCLVNNLRAVLTAPQPTRLMLIMMLIAPCVTSAPMPRGSQISSDARYAQLQHTLVIMDTGPTLTRAGVTNRHAHAQR